MAVADPFASIFQQVPQTTTDIPPPSVSGRGFGNGVFAQQQGFDRVPFQTLSQMNEASGKRQAEQVMMELAEQGLTPDKPEFYEAAIKRVKDPRIQMALVQKQQEFLDTLSTRKKQEADTRLTGVQADVLPIATQTDRMSAEAALENSRKKETPEQKALRESRNITQTAQEARRTNADRIERELASKFEELGFSGPTAQEVKNTTAVMANAVDVLQDLTTLGEVTPNGPAQQNSWAFSLGYKDWQSLLESRNSLVNATGEETGEATKDFQQRLIDFSTKVAIRARTIRSQQGPRAISHEGAVALARSEMLGWIETTDPKDGRRIAVNPNTNPPQFVRLD